MMNRIWGILLSGALLFSLGTSAYAATAVRAAAGTAEKQINTQYIDVVQHNMSIKSYYGDALGNRFGNINREQIFDYSIRRDTYTPPLVGELGVVNSFWINQATGTMAQDWNNQGKMQEVGWGYGGVGNLGLNTPVDWTNIIEIANNTLICPGRTQALTYIDKNGNKQRLAWFNGLDGAESEIYIDDKAYEEFIKDNKTVSSISEHISTSYQYQYIDGQLIRVEIENWRERNETIYDLAIDKTVSPIVLDIAGSGKIEASNGQYLPHSSFDSKNVIVTDFWGDGFEIAMEWVGPNDGLLVAPKADGSVDMSCLFGVADGFDNGYEKLKLYADNDGIVRGKQLSRLSVWQDVNRNGIAEKGELRSCAELGITSIDTNHKGFVSSFEINGKKQLCWDWWPNAFELRTMAVAK